MCCKMSRRTGAVRWPPSLQSPVTTPAKPGLPLSCVPAVVMQKASQGANWTENADKADETEFAQPAYFLWLENGMNQMRECMAERVGFEPTVLVKVHTLSKRAP